MTPDAGTAGALVSGLCAWIDRLFPDPDRGERLTRAFEERFGGDPRAVTDELCREVETVAHDFSRHLALEYVAGGSLVPDTEPPGWPPQDPGEVRLRAASVGAVTRRPDGAGVLALDGLDGVHIAAPYLEAAFGLLRGARGVVLDLRVTGHVRAILPEARVRDAVTGSNSEATGVVPGIPCESEDAVDAAIEALSRG
jgi:hypothetical protein